jgi:hypothetical protein
MGLFYHNGSELILRPYFVVCQDQSFALSLGFNLTPELEDVIINNTIK